MKVPRVKQCCCGCTLQTGCKIIGYVGVIVAVLLCVLYGCMLAIANHVIKNDHTNENSPSPAQIEEAEAVLLVLKITVGIVIAIGITAIIFNVLLIVGATKEIRRFLRAWIIYTICITVISILVRLLMVFGSFENNEASHIIRELLTLIVSTLLTIYYIIVVHSYDKELQLRDQRQKMEMMTS